jgi:hypothetical protein
VGTVGHVSQETVLKHVHAQKARTVGKPKPSNSSPNELVGLLEGRLLQIVLWAFPEAESRGSEGERTICMTMHNGFSWPMEAVVAP